MRRRGGPSGTAVRPRFLLALTAGLILLAATSLWPAEPEARTIRVKLAADRDIENMREWRIAAVRLFDGCFRSFAGKLGIRLAIEEIVTWKPEPGRRRLVDLLSELRREIRPGKCDIILGVISPERADDAPLGIASYPHACVLVKNLPSREAMVYAVLHELCHVFGAVDIREKDSVMGIEAPGFAIDGFTAAAVLLNKDRSFDREGFPLGPIAIGGALSLFDRRAQEGRREPQVALMLTLLYLEKDDLAAAARACAAAAAADPTLPGLHNLMGNICLFRGDYDLAIVEYRRAAESQPREPGIRFNLGLAYVQLGQLDEATAAFREALREDPAYEEARRALESVLRAGPDGDAARTAIRPFLLAIQKPG